MNMHKFKVGDKFALTENYGGSGVGAQFVVTHAEDAKDSSDGQLLYASDLAVYSRRVKLLESPK